MERVKEKQAVMAVFLLAMAFNLCLWSYGHHLQPRWGNVPPVPSGEAAALITLGDRQLAYRSFALLLQNLGDAGGEARPLKMYDYSRLAEWFWLEDHLDPASNFIPALAAFYFSANQDKQAIGPIIDYLAEVGQRPQPQKWRWLAQAVYLSRFVVHDYDKSLMLAEKLAALDQPGLPAWTKQMPAFVKLEQGDKEGAYAIMLNVLNSEVKTLQPAEVNAIRAYICDRVLSPSQKSNDPLCKDPY